MTLRQSGPNQTPLRYQRSPGSAREVDTRERRRYPRCFARYRERVRGHSDSPPCGRHRPPANVHRRSPPPRLPGASRRTEETCRPASGAWCLEAWEYQPTAARPDIEPPDMNPAIVTADRQQLAGRVQRDLGCSARCMQRMRTRNLYSGDLTPRTDLPDGDISILTHHRHSAPVRCGASSQQEGAHGRNRSPDRDPYLRCRTQWRAARAEKSQQQVCDERQRAFGQVIPSLMAILRPLRVLCRC
jgi:hypothetical protein